MVIVKNMALRKRKAKRGKRSLKEQVYADFMEFAEHTSAHGIPRLRSTKHFCRKSLWILLFFACMAAFSVQAVLIAKKFMRNEKIVNVELKFERIPFPAVTVCNLNPYKNSLARGVSSVQATLSAFDDAMVRTKEKQRSSRAKRQIEELGINNGVTTMSPSRTTTEPHLVDRRLVKPVIVKCRCASRSRECFVERNWNDRCICFRNSNTKDYWPCYHISHWTNESCSNCQERSGTCLPPDNVERAMDNSDGRPCVCQDISSLCAIVNPEFDYFDWSQLALVPPQEELAVELDVGSGEGEPEPIAPVAPTASSEAELEVTDDDVESRESELQETIESEPQVTIPIFSRKWLATPIRSACNCPDTSGSCVVSDDPYAVSECICVHDVSVTAQPYFSCAVTLLWEEKRCGQCTTHGYCAYPIFPVDEQFWSTECLCHRSHYFCIAVDTGVNGEGGGHILDALPTRALTLNREKRMVVDETRHQVRHPRNKDSLKPAYTACDCRSDTDCDASDIHQTPTENDTICLCFYNTQLKNGAVWPCYPPYQWHRRQCHSCMGIGSCSYVTDDDKGGSYPCICVDIIRMCVRVDVNGDDSIEDLRSNDTDPLSSKLGPDLGADILKIWEIPTTQTPISSAELQFKQAMGFEGMKDPVAIVNRARENLVFAVAKMDETQKSSLSYSKMEFITKCSFNGRACSIDKDFTLFLDPSFGNCYTFNYNPAENITSERSGPSYGLRFQIFVNISDYLPTTEAAGARITVHPQDEQPFPDTFGYGVPTGFVSSFGIHLKRMVRLPAPYGDCVMDGKNDDFIFRDKAYSTEGCHRSCVQRYLVEKCGCGDPRFPRFRNSDNCPVDEPLLRECLQREIAFAARRRNDLDCHCPQPCTQLVYSVSYSASKWPAGPAQITDCPKGLLPNQCLDYFREQGAMVEIYFEELNYESLLESEAYGLPNLLSDFGGQLGLWMGVSVITVMEAGILLWDLLVTVCCCRRAPRTTRQSGPTTNDDDIEIEGPFFVIENGTKESTTP